MVTRAAAVLKEPEILKRRGDRRLLRPVWAAAQGLRGWEESPPPLILKSCLLTEVTKCPRLAGTALSAWREASGDSRESLRSHPSPSRCRRSRQRFHAAPPVPPALLCTDLRQTAVPICRAEPPDA